MIREFFYVEDFIPNHLLNILISWAVEAPTKKDNYNDIDIELIQLAEQDSNIATAFLELNKLVHRTIEKKFMCSLYREELCSMVVYRANGFLPKHIDNVPGQNLPTPSGNILKELFASGIRLGISSRGMGSVRKNVHEAADEVQDDFELIAFDFVSNPSTRGAFMYPEEQVSLQEGVVKNPETNKWEKVENIIRDILGEIK